MTTERLIPIFLAATAVLSASSGCSSGIAEPLVVIVAESDENRLVKWPARVSAPMATTAAMASATMAVRRRREVLPGCDIRAAFHPYVAKC
jgi:hypothetical protein